MATNFYLRGYRNNTHPNFHIGKQVQIFDVDKGPQFIWAMTESYWKHVRELPFLCCSACRRIYDDYEKIIEDEHGKYYTIKEFEELIQNLTMDDSQRGKEFC